MTIERLLYSPLALLPAHALALLDRIRMLDADSDRMESARAAPRPFDVVSGVAVIPICGILVHQATWWFDETQYSGIRQSVAMAAADPDVRGIALYVNSPGGEVAGCFDLADDIYALRGGKPIWAILDESAYSAAYALASAAERIIVPRTGGTGSIGVVSLRLDLTAALDQGGIKIHAIQYGARKTDSYPITPLSDDARARIQADVDTLGAMFVAMVARNRNMAPDDVIATEAGMFLGAAGVAAGLADAVMAPDDAFLAFVQHLES